MLDKSFHLFEFFKYAAENNKSILSLKIKSLKIKFFGYRMKGRNIYTYLYYSKYGEEEKERKAMILLCAVYVCNIKYTYIRILRKIRE